jgi:hypothetical protein
LLGEPFKNPQYWFLLATRVDDAAAEVRALRGIL